MTVKNSIQLLLDYPMDAEVYLQRYGKCTLLNYGNVELDKDNDLVISE